MVIADGGVVRLCLCNVDGSFYRVFFQVVNSTLCHVYLWFAWGHVHVREIKATLALAHFVLACILQECRTHNHLLGPVINNTAKWIINILNLLHLTHQILLFIILTSLHSCLPFITSLLTNNIRCLHILSNIWLLHIMNDIWCFHVLYAISFSHLLMILNIVDRE